MIISRDNKFSIINSTSCLEIPQFVNDMTNRDRGRKRERKKKREREKESEREREREKKKEKERRYL